MANAPLKATDGGLVYHAFCTDNGKTYVGQTIDTLDARRKAHLQPGRKNGCRLFKNALRKHGPNAFVWTVLTTCQTQQELNDAETYWIEFFDTLAPNGYNLMKGGGAAGRRTPEAKAYLREVFARPEVKARRSAAQRASHARPETRLKDRLGKLGKKRSAEDRLKMSEGRKGLRWRLVDGRRVFFRTEVNDG